MIIGLTGGICTGKSVATAVLGQAGLHIIDCDQLARFLTDYEPQVRAAIRSHFGAQVFHSGGALLRHELGRIIFGDPAARKVLEQILHPRIMEWVSLNISSARCHQETLVVVVPLLFELAMEEQFDETWLVTCNPMAQLQRLVERSGMTEGEARAWIEAQWSQERKLPLASRVLSNDATIADFKVEVLKTLEGVVNR